MPDKITLNTLLLCCLFALPGALRGQTPSGKEHGLDTVRYIRPQAWYFAYESLEKALDGDIAASARYILKGEDGWKFATEDLRYTTRFYTKTFNDSSWKTTSLPRKQENGEADTGIASGDAILYRRQFTLKESSLSGQEFFLYLDFPGLVTCWVNGQQAGGQEGDSARVGGVELNITRLLQAGGNLVALRVAGESGQVLENDSGVGEVMLYARPQTHLTDIGVNSTLNGSNGLLELDMSVVNRMDSVRERFWGVLREPLYSTVDVKAELIDDKGNTILVLNKESNERIQGGNQAVFHFEGKVSAVRPWNHESPVRYRLNLLLLDGAGNVLEAVSRQIGFRTAEASGPEGLLVNGDVIPLRIYRPGARPSYGLSRQQMLEDIRLIKQGHFNAVPIAPYRRYRQWYELCAEHGVYLLDRAPADSPHNTGQPGTDGSSAYQGWHGTGSNPALIHGSGEILTEATSNEVVELELGDFLKGTVRIRNDFGLRDLSGYYLEWSVLRNGETAEEGRLERLEVRPGAEATLSLGYKTRFYEGNDYFLNLRVKTKAADGMIPADFAVASRQFRLGPYRYQEGYQVDKGLIDMTDGPGNIALNGYDFRIVFDKSTGHITRYSYRGKELVNAGPELGFGNDLSGNDPAGNDPSGKDPLSSDDSSTGNPSAGDPAAGSASARNLPEGGNTDTLGESRALWTQAVRESNLLEYKVTEDVNGNYYISFTNVLLGGDARLFQHFRVDGKGAILVENIFVKMKGDYPVMPGFGTVFSLPEAFRRMEWYGREPAAHNEVGVYSDTIPGQPGSAKTDVRWARLTRNDGYGLLIRQENKLFHLTTRRDQPAGPVLLSVDLSHAPVPFKSWNFSYRLIPYISSESVQ